MASRYNSTQNVNLTTSLGGTISAADSCFVSKWATDYSAGTDLSAADLTLFEIQEGAEGSLATANGGGLVLVANQTSTGIFRNRGSMSRVDLRSTSASGVIYNVENNPALASSILQIATGDYNQLRQKSGVLLVDSTADLNNAEITGGQTVLANATYAMTLCKITGGTNTIARDVATLSISGGVNTIDHTDVTPTTLNLDGGVVNVNEMGTVSTLNAVAGVLDFTKNRRMPAFSAGSIGPGVTVRARAGQTLPDFSSLTKHFGGPRYEILAA
jgi:hypothetical protein